jgi:glycosyltransferase involved in cell wall biosynthesis
LLAHAIRSVLSQSYEDLELIVVDDNSPDDTRAVVATFNDPRIRYVRNEPNLKLPRALNRGFSLARGQYLTWTSDDNLYAPTAIERMANELRIGKADFVYADYWLFSDTDAEGRPLATQLDKLPDQLQLVKGNHIGACFMYTRKLYEAVGDYDPELFLVEDYDYFIRAARRFRFHHIPEALYYFRRDDNTLYLSRFCEVKASDMLVRFKNGFLDEDGVVSAMLDLITRHPERLANPLLRRSFLMLGPLSYRLTQRLKGAARSYLYGRLQPVVCADLKRYRNGESTFRQSRDALVQLMQRHAAIAYANP